MYEKQDSWRTKKWALANPKVADKQNIEQLKKLIAIHLTKPRKKPQPVKGYDSSPILTLAKTKQKQLQPRASPPRILNKIFYDLASVNDD